MKYDFNIIIIFLAVCLIPFQTFSQEQMFNSNTDLNISSNNTSNQYKSVKNTSDFKGKVYMGDNPLTRGKIFLFEKFRNNYSYSVSQKIQNGSFYLKNVNLGNYIVYVIPELDYDFLYYPKYLPTYSGNTCIWEKSEFEMIKNDNSDFEIHLNSYSDPYYGHQEISGSFEFLSSYEIPSDVPVVVLLLNADKVPMDFRTVDQGNGRFSFEYLPEGKYYIHPEIAGIQSNDYEIELTDNSTEIKFNISDEMISLEENNIEVQIDNNAQNYFIRLHLDEFPEDNIICELISMNGKSISKDIYHTDNVRINTSNLASGIYIVKVSTYDYKNIKTQKVYINNYD